MLTGGKTSAVAVEYASTAYQTGLRAFWAASAGAAVAGPLTFGATLLVEAPRRVRKSHSASTPLEGTSDKAADYWDRHPGQWFDDTRKRVPMTFRRGIPFRGHWLGADLTRLG